MKLEYTFMRQRRRLVGVLVPLFVLTLSGCFRTYHTSRSRVGPPPMLGTEAWPEWDLTEIQKLADATPGTIPRWELVPNARELELSDADREKLTEHKRTIEYSRVVAGGLLRVWSHDEPDTASREFMVRLYGGFDPNASFVSAHKIGDPRLGEAVEDVVSRDRARSPAADSMLLKSSLDERLLLDEGVRIQMPGRATSTPKGLVVHLLSLIPNEYESSVVGELRSRGWAVVSLESSTGLWGPRDPDEMATIPELKGRINELNERAAALAMPPNPGTLTRQELNKEISRRLADPGVRKSRAELEGEIAMLDELVRRIRRGRFECPDLSSADGVGARFADAIDGLLAENTYAAEAVVRYLHSERPDISHDPVVIMGFSAGALAAPAVAARLGTIGMPPAAVVLVAGGADLAEIMHTTSHESIVAPIESRGGPVPEDIWIAIHASYRAHTRLDPIRTAPLLAGTPVLQIHATEDTIVPARTGRELYTLLAEPDRIDFSRGHRELFYYLPGIKERIADWVERHALESNRDGDAIPHRAGR